MLGDPEIPLVALVMPHAAVQLKEEVLRKGPHVVLLDPLEGVLDVAMTIERSAVV